MTWWGHFSRATNLAISARTGLSRSSQSDTGGFTVPRKMLGCHRPQHNLRPLRKSFRRCSIQPGTGHCRNSWMLAVEVSWHICRWLPNTAALHEGRTSANVTWSRRVDISRVISSKRPPEHKQSLSVDVLCTDAAKRNCAASLPHTRSANQRESQWRAEPLTLLSAWRHQSIAT